jgi:predicted MFS family arabinose efflux permease
MSLNILACLALPLLGQSLSGALIGLFLFYLSFEFTLVSIIPVMTELVPNARATTMSAFIAGLASGRGIGAILGPILFRSGLLANCLLTATFDITALVILFLLVRE